MSAVMVTRAGPLASVQDSGRFGVRHLGLTQGGALDWQSQYWANWMLGNPLGAAVLEITLGGLQLLCQDNGWLALAGADLGATLDGRALLPWRPFEVRAGQTISFETPRLGARAYLAVPGGIKAPVLAGSCATVAREQVGGLYGDGLALKVGDLLEWSGVAIGGRSVPTSQIPDFRAQPELELILGAQIGGFSGQSLFDAFNNEWVVDGRSDRMGLRLTGTPLRYDGAGLVSEGIPLGAVQVPPDGQPIVLLNDRQTIGGYPRLGALSPLAVTRLAQCLPGTVIKLRPQVLFAAQESHRKAISAFE